MTQKKQFNQCVGNSMVYSNFHMLPTVCTLMLNADGELYVYIVCVFLLIIIIIIYTTYIAPYIWPVWPFIGAEEGPSKY